MKKIAMILGCLFAVVILLSATNNDDTMVKENGVYIVNTTQIGKDVMGYEGPTPLKVFIKDGKVQKIEFLDNRETPRYWAAAVRHLQNKWDGMTVEQVKSTQVDGRTGATYSSDAIKQNVRLAVEYYEQHK